MNSKLQNAERIAAIILMLVLSFWIHDLDKTTKQAKLTLQTYGKLGNESRALVAQEKFFLDTALPSTFASVNTVLSNVSTTTTHLQTTVDKMGALADSLQQTGQQATQTLATAQQGAQGAAVALTDAVQATLPAINNIGKATGSAQQTTDRLNMLLSSPELQATLTNAQITSSNLVRASGESAGILADTHRVSTKVADKITKRHPWYLRWLPW